MLLVILCIMPRTLKESLSTQGEMSFSNAKNYLAKLARIAMAALSTKIGPNIVFYSSLYVRSILKVELVLFSCLHFATSWDYIIYRASWSSTCLLVYTALYCRATAGHNGPFFPLVE